MKEKMSEVKKEDVNELSGLRIKRIDHTRFWCGCGASIDKVSISNEMLNDTVIF